jgi:hypothetical protein
MSEDGVAADIATVRWPRWRAPKPFRDAALRLADVVEDLTAELAETSAEVTTTQRGVLRERQRAMKAEEQVAAMRAVIDAAVEWFNGLTLAERSASLDRACLADAVAHYLAPTAAPTTPATSTCLRCGSNGHWSQQCPGHDPAYATPPSEEA